MNTIVSVRTNILYQKQKNENQEIEYKRHQELIFLVEKPTYRFSQNCEIIRDRALEELRFVVSQNNFDTLIKMLEELKNAEETDLA